MIMGLTPPVFICVPKQKGRYLAAWQMVLSDKIDNNVQILMGLQKPCSILNM